MPTIVDEHPQPESLPGRRLSGPPTFKIRHGYHLLDQAKVEIQVCHCVIPCEMAASKLSTFTYTTLDHARSLIRPLRLNHSADPKTPMRYHLFHVPLEAGPDYEALRHTWGDSVKPRSIIVCSSPVLLRCYTVTMDSTMDCGWSQKSHVGQRREPQRGMWIVRSDVDCMKLVMPTLSVTCSRSLTNTSNLVSRVNCIAGWRPDRKDLTISILLSISSSSA